MYIHIYDVVSLSIYHQIDLFLNTYWFYPVLLCPTQWCTFSVRLRAACRTTSRYRYNHNIFKLLCRYSKSMVTLKHDASKRIVHCPNIAFHMQPSNHTFFTLNPKNLQRTFYYLFHVLYALAHQYWWMRLKALRPICLHYRSRRWPF